MSIETGGQKETQVGNYSKPREAINFLRASPFQQFFVSLDLAAIALSANMAIEHSSMLGLSIALFNAAIAGANEFAAYSKFNEYKKVRKLLSRYGWDERIIRPKSNSWCQRNAARVAAIDTGHKAEIKKYFGEKGYKWYHFC